MISQRRRQRLQIVVLLQTEFGHHFVSPHEGAFSRASSGIKLLGNSELRDLEAILRLEDHLDRLAFHETAIVNRTIKSEHAPFILHPRNHYAQTNKKQNITGQLGIQPTYMSHHLEMNILDRKTRIHRYLLIIETH
jgi:hypothetical protein